MPDAERPPAQSPFTANSNYGKLFAMILLLAIGALIVYHRSEPAVHAIDGYTMGSTWSVRFTAPAHADVNAVRTQLEQLLAELDLALSGYREDSALARLNTAPVGQWIEIPNHLTNVLLFGLELWRESGGAFDMTVKPLVSLWGFGAAQPRYSVPAEAEIAAALARIGSDRLELAADGCCARRTFDINVDVDGIAPGYSSGVLSSWLTLHGFPNHLVEVGGEMRASGIRPDGGGWRIAIEAPELARGRIERVISVTDTAISTAGDYRDYFEVNGTRYQHIIDPVSGRPATHNLASVTVLAPGKLTADGYATAIMVLGEEKGLVFADAHRLPVFIIGRRDDGTFYQRYNKRFAPYLATD